MSEKKYTVKVILVSVIVCLLVLGTMGLCNYFIDPVFYFHDSLSGNYWFAEQHYQNLGAIKNMEYDSVIVGASTSNNFKTQWVDDVLDCSSIQVSLAGAHFKDFNEYFRRIFNSGKDIRNVVFGFDIINLIAGPEETNVKYDGFLAERGFSFVNYLFNKSVFLDYDFSRNFGALTFSSYDEMYNATYSTDDKTSIAYGLKSILSNTSRPLSMTSLSNGQYNDVYYAMDSNIDSLYRIISENSDTDFYIILMPANMVYWDYLTRTGYKDPAIDGIRMLYERILNLENVKIYSYLDDTNIITNFDLYYDGVHSMSSVQEQIINGFATDSHLAQTDTWESNLSEFIVFLDQYDYDALFDNN